MTEIMKSNLPYGIIQIDPSLQLRQLDLEDAEYMFSLVDANRDYLKKWLPWVDSTMSAKDSEKFISEMLEKRITGSEYGYAIVVDGFPVGHISLMHLPDGKEPEIGYWIASNVSGRGIATKAADALTNFGFDTLRLPKIIIKADKDNIPSNKVAEKLSYKIERTEQGGAYTDNLANVWSKTNE